MCGEHEIAPRLIQDLLENFSGRCWPRSPREIVFSGILESFKKYFYQIGSIGDRSSKVWLGSSGFSNFWPSIVTGLTCNMYIICKKDKWQTRNHGLATRFLSCRPQCLNLDPRFSLVFFHSFKRFLRGSASESFALSPLMPPRREHVRGPRNAGSRHDFGFWAAFSSLSFGCCQGEALGVAREKLNKQNMKNIFKIGILFIGILIGPNKALLMAASKRLPYRTTVVA